MCEAKVFEVDMSDSPDDINECSTPLVRQLAKGTFNTFISTTVIG